MMGQAMKSTGWARPPNSLPLLPSIPYGVMLPRIPERMDSSLAIIRAAKKDAFEMRSVKNPSAAHRRRLLALFLSRTNATRSFIMQVTAAIPESLVGKDPSAKAQSSFWR